MRYVGFDPDYHKSGLAELVCSPGPICTAGALFTLSLHSSLKGMDAVRTMARLACLSIEARDYTTNDVIMVEAPVVYTSKVEAKEAVRGLDLIAGAVIGAFPGRALVVTPHEWKGNKKKKAHHKEILRKVSELIGENDFEDPTSHEIDALGMALLAFNRDEGAVKRLGAIQKLESRRANRT